MNYETSWSEHASNKLLDLKESILEFLFGGLAIPGIAISLANIVHSVPIESLRHPDFNWIGQLSYPLLFLVIGKLFYKHHIGRQRSIVAAKISNVIGAAHPYEHDLLILAITEGRKEISYRMGTAELASTAPPNLQITQRSKPCDEASGESSVTFCLTPNTRAFVVQNLEAIKQEYYKVLENRLKKLGQPNDAVREQMIEREAIISAVLKIGQEVWSKHTVSNVDVEKLPKATRPYSTPI